ncbi:hypothetical protein Fmac_032894 [Flemingia macrophylla]|uniref:Uncharacterized protein n=1 Tax=Flemingia macrophylla TaxID=520843 RepID=A0ABD1L680_9FABA
MTTILVSVLLCSNLEWMIILRLRKHLWQPTTAAETRHLIEKIAPNSQKREGKLDALVNLLTQLTANQKPTSVAIVCGIRSSNDHHTNDHGSRDKAHDGEDGSQLLAVSARNDAIVIRGVHDVGTDTSAETRKLEGKLDALVNLVTQLATNQKSASVARVYADHHSSKDKGHDREDGSRLLAIQCKNDVNVIRGVHDVSTDRSAETRKLEGKLDALSNCVCPSSQQSGVDEHPEVYAANTYSRPPQERKTRHLIEKIAPNS